jgi:putative peptidoglycan lipid II flippase
MTNSGRQSPKRSASALVAAGILLSRLSGLVRQATFAAFMGQGAAFDAFGAATRIPNILQNLLGEGALSASFIPVYSGELDRDEEEAGRIAGAVASIIALIASIVVVIGVVAARPIATVLVWGFRDDARFELTVTLIRITFPAAGLLVLSGWCLGILNSHRHFFLSYVAPVIWNVAQIAAVSGVVLIFGVGDVDVAPRGLEANVDAFGGVAEAAAWGFLVGSALQFLVQVPTVRKLATGLKFSLDTKRAGVREVRRRFGGSLLGRGVVQISAYIDTLLASLLVTGAVGALINTQVLYLLPVSLFAVSIAASELPELSRLKADHAAIRERAERGFGRIAFFVAFTALAYVILGDKIAGALYERGRFTSDDTLLVWFVLGSYALGLPASSLSRLTQNTLWSQGDTAGPAKIAFVRMVLSGILAATLMWFFDKIAASDIRDALPTIADAPEVTNPADADLLRFGAMGIALAAAIAAWTEAVLLGRLARRTVAGIAPLAPLRRMLPALGAAGVVAIICRFITDGWWPPLGAVVGVGAAGVAYVLTARATGVDESNLVLVGPLSRLRR